MKFVCSINSVVAEHVDSKTGKIGAKGNFTAFNQNWEALELGVEELAEFAALKCGLCAWHLINGKELVIIQINQSWAYYYRHR
jgi:hypothetical protein